MIDYDSSEKLRFYQKNDPHQKDERDEFELDRSRIIHSAAFRRLQSKTQVFGLGGSDFFRTRLTHSLEAAQIGKGLAMNSGADTNLVEAACLAHDIGHPPFGHAGEEKLQEMMKDFGGFEGNAQNLRLIHYLELKHPDGGLNLTRATIDGILKYKIGYTEATKKKEKKFVYDDDLDLVKWASEGSPPGNTKSLECEIISWADDIAYSTHDLEDGIKSGLITTGSINQVEKKVKKEIIKKYDWNEGIWDEVTSIITSFEKPSSEKERKLHRKQVISKTIHEFIQSAKPTKREGELMPRYQYQLDVDENIRLKCKMLKSLVWEAVIINERLATLSRKAEIVVENLFNEFTKDNSENMLPPDFQEMIENTDDVKKRKRIICDYIAGMTDQYALKIYGRLFSHEISSVFEII